MKLSSIKRFVGAYIVAIAMMETCSCLAAEPVVLPNGGFEDGAKGWATRTSSDRVYQVQAPGYEGKGYVRLQVSEQDTQQEREAVHFNRRDLPTAEGYYRLRYAARSELKKGQGGASVTALGPDNKVLAVYRAGSGGLRALQGSTPWTEYSFVYYVPAGTTLNVLQLEGINAIGTIDYDDIKIEKLDTETGKKMLQEQKTQLIIPSFVPVPSRTPQVPLKTQRMIYTDTDIAAARANIKEYPQAKAVLDAILKIADPWLEWSDEDLRKLLTTAQVPRAFDLNVNGCPVHGAEVFNRGGAYPWKLDPRRPFKVICPVGDEIYPSNDYEVYYHSGFKEKKGWDTQYVDDGWGWVDPKNGERYWFVAYANQWNWYKTINPALLNLSRAYLLTGEKKYAHKVAVMLARLAEVYPAMDYENQSRYGLMMKAIGSRYPGKVLYHTWESFFARDFAEAYDSVWDSIDDDTVLQKQFGKTGPELRALIEANLLEDAVDAYQEHKIEGNFGMHQTALLHILLARQNLDVKKWSRVLVDEPGDRGSDMGLRYALYNMIWRDGTPLESPGYNMLWLENYALLGELLKKGGTNLFSEPKMKLLFDSPLNIVSIGLHTPAHGDSASVLAGLVGRDNEVYSTAYRAYKDERYLPWLGGGKEDNRGFTSFRTLFNPPLPVKPILANGRAVAPQPSRLLAGNGVGILNNPTDTVSVAMTYGMHVSHFHYDFLHIDLFANGQAMLPDMGYGDAMNAYVSGIYTWTLNTVAHNTVVVDAQRQPFNRPGTLLGFVNSPFVRSMDASSPAYDQTTQYRRHVIQVDVDDNRSYVVDVFRVKGGKQHDYSLHGPPGQVETGGSVWSAPAPGTLAGPEVALEKIYDDAVLGADGYKSGYTGYKGSGFQHLFNVQKLQKGTGTLHYRHVRDAKAELKIHPLTQNASEVFLADAYDLPRARKHQVKYLITRRKSEGGAPLESTFISVLEPFSGQTFIQSTEVLSLTGGAGTAVKVQRDGGTDVILSDPNGTRKQLPAYKLETDANSAVVSFDSTGKLQRVFFSGGSFLQCGEQKFTAAPVHGTVSAVDAMAQTISVALPAQNNVDASLLAQRVAHFSNPWHETVHPVASAARQGNILTLKTVDAILVGRALARKTEEAKVSTDTSLPFAETYPGTTLLSNDFTPIGLVKVVKSGEIELATKPTKAVPVEKDVWFSNIGVGDKVEFASLFHWTRN